MLAIFIILEKSILWCDLILIRAMVFKFFKLEIIRNFNLRLKNENLTLFLAMKKSYRITISLLNGS